MAAAMREVGIDLSTAVPKRLTDEAVREADAVITMGCGDACPVYRGKRYLDWDLPIPPDSASRRCGPFATRSAGASALILRSSVPQRRESLRAAGMRAGRDISRSPPARPAA